MSNRKFKIIITAEVARYDIERPSDIEEYIRENLEGPPLWVRKVEVVEITDSLVQIAVPTASKK